MPAGTEPPPGEDAPAGAGVAGLIKAKVRDVPDYPQAGIEARGFILAAPVASQLGSGFVPVRKHGRLPGPTYAESYDLEYGTATIEVHQDAFAPGERVLIVDDVLATGGTAAATVTLVERAGAEVVGVAVILELAFLGGRARLATGQLRSLLVV